MTSTVTVRHNFETGHRLPQLRGKCTSLHGHSWWAEVTVTSDTTPLVVEFGAFKARFRQWIDLHLDHGLMLGVDDPLLPVLRKEGKVFIFGELQAVGLDWPTVENTAALLARVADSCLAEVEHHRTAAVTGVTVSETHVNKAGWAA